MKKFPQKYLKMGIFNLLLIIVDVFCLSNGFLGLLSDKDNTLAFAGGITLIIMSIVLFFYVNYTLLQGKEHHDFNVKDLEASKDYIEVLNSLKNKQVFEASILEAIEQIKRLERKNKSYKEIYYQKFQEDSNGTNYGFDDIISDTEKLLYKNIDKMINVLIIFDYVEYRQLVTKVKRDHHEEKIKLMNDSINYVTDIIRKNEEILLNEDKLLIEMSKIGDTEEDDEVNLARIHDIVESMKELRVSEM